MIMNGLYKKVIFGTLIGIFVGGLLLGINGVSQASSESEYELWYYPVTPQDDEWKEMSFAEAIASCEMPDGVADVMTTEELAKLALEYPFMINVFFFDDLNQGVERLARQSNVVGELLSRSDVGSVLCKMYLEHEIDLEKYAQGYSLSECGYFQSVALQSLLGYEGVLSTLDTQSKIALCNKTWENISEQEAQGCELASSSILLNAQIQENENVEMFSISAEVLSTTNGYVAGSYSFADGDGTVYNIGRYYKYGTSAECFRYTSNDYSDAEKAAKNKEIANTYPSWTYVGSATKAFNCHAFTWIISGGQFIYWLNDPTPFMNASGYVTNLGTDVAITASGQRVVIYNSDGIAHSLTTNGASSGSGKTSWMTTTTCTSKMGEYGIYRTTLYDAYLVYDGLYYKVFD